MSNDAWKDWRYLKAKVLNLPADATTLTAYKLLKNEGEIVKVEILKAGGNSSMAFVTFR